MFDEQRPCRLNIGKEKYISLTVKLAFLPILFVLQFIAPLLQDPVLLFYHGGPCKHIYCCSLKNYAQPRTEIRPLSAYILHAW